MLILKKIGYALYDALMFLVRNWRITLPAIALGIIVFFVFRSCGRSKGIDVKNIEKINSENKAERQQELREVVEENADAIKTVDGRTTIAETNVVERDRLVDEKVKEADKKIEEAKQQGQDVSSEQLECILLPEKCQ
jgi:DNA-binding transcriptional MerR regulator